MLYVKFGNIVKTNDEPLCYLRYAEDIFDSNYKDRWLKSEFARKVIKCIDKSEVVSNNMIESPVLGLIPTDWLSGGSKTLILASEYDGIVLKGETMGDNCWYYLLELSLIKDIQVSLNYWPIFDEWPEGAVMKDIDTGKTASSYNEFYDMHNDSESSLETITFNDTEWVLPVNKEIFTFDWNDDK